MTHIYPIPNNNALYLYTNEHQILLRARTSDGMTRPTLLAGDYADGLCDTLFQGVIYFAYLSQNNKLVVRNTQVQSSFYEIPLSSAFVLQTQTLQLCSLEECLLLFYMATDAKTGISSLHLDFPLNPEKNDIFYNTPVTDTQPVSNEKELLELKNALTTLREELKQSQQETAHYQTMLESATVQYNDLMHVAEKYREEAIKWRNKFIIRE